MAHRSGIIILGIDPGTLVTGFGLIQKSGSKCTYIEAGTINTSPKDSLPIRLRKIYDRILHVINEYHPDQCGIETAFFGKNIQSTLKLGHARGVAILAAVHREVPIIEYSPREVKRSVTGNGASSKQQVAYMVKSILNVKEMHTSHDVSAALAIALCHAQHLTAPREHFKNWKSFIDEHPERVRSKK